MADNQPEPQTAPNGQTPQGQPSEPAQKPADQTPAAPSISFDSFSDEEKKYLAGQGITKQEELTTDAIRKVINHSQSSQKTAAERQAELDRIRQSINPATVATDPLTGQPVQPQATTPTQTPANPQTPEASQAPVASLDPVTAYNLSFNLGNQFPELKDKLTDGSFYKEMNELGIPTTVNGQVNLNGIIGYGRIAQKEAQIAAKLAELEKPGEGVIPDANPTTPQQPASDAPMTKQMALAILAQDTNHPRAAEAREFIQVK